ncbi:glutathione S-transferase [Citromicrobium bathyomarinum]|uniref:glutathione S-transferase n=1 Tax=Citromicrobium bathyomarinum TaxID=72174 RepID=UPI003159E392
MRSDPILYSFRRCPYAMRARLALAICETRYVLREVKLARKPAELIEASPKGTVPVLVLPDGTVIDESIEIVRWALAQSDPEGWLDRDDAGLIERNDGSFKHDLDRYKYPDRHQSDAMLHRQRGLEFLRLLDERLSEHPQLCGSQRGITDAAIMPFVRQFAAVERDWFAAQPIPHLQKWLEHHLSSPLFLAIMVRFDPWAPGDRAVTMQGCAEPS